MIEHRASVDEVARVARFAVRGAKHALWDLDKEVKAASWAYPWQAGDHYHAGLDLYAKTEGRAPAERVELEGKINRMVDPNWWERGLRKTVLRENEAAEFKECKIRKKQQVYVSDFAVQRLRKQAEKNRKTLEKLEVQNERGDSLNLLEVADASTSNPKLRRLELMTRIDGMTQVAELCGHVAVFVTWTLPSRYHRFDASGKPNKKWEGAIPKDGQLALCATWARARAELKRRGIYPYGFRVAEPHHDGCPHWHMLLFVPADKLGWFEARRYIAGRDDSGAGLLGVLGAYALTDCPAEYGAEKARFKAVAIKSRLECITLPDGRQVVKSDENGQLIEVLGKNGKPVSATAYIAKYIGKNILGMVGEDDAVGLDFASGKKATDTAQRVRAWASVWGIRQFQQVGGASVTVYRQLRRLGKANPSQLELFEHVRDVADRGLYGMYWQVMGGHETLRSEHLYKAVYELGEQGRYGEAIKAVTGVRAYDTEAQAYRELRTKLHTWTVQVAGIAAYAEGRAVAVALRDYAKGVPVQTPSISKHKTAVMAAIGEAIATKNIAEMDAIRSAEIADFEMSEATRTGVNNCTPADDEYGKTEWILSQKIDEPEDYMVASLAWETRREPEQGDWMVRQQVESQSDLLRVLTAWEAGEKLREIYGKSNTNRPD